MIPIQVEQAALAAYKAMGGRDKWSALTQTYWHDLVLSFARHPEAVPANAQERAAKTAYFNVILPVATKPVIKEVKAAKEPHGGIKIP